MFWLSGPDVCGILASHQGMEPAPPALEGEVLPTGPPGKALSSYYSWVLLILWGIVITKTNPIIYKV